MNKNKNIKTRRRACILTALLTLTLVGEAGAFAQQPESASVASVKQLAAITSAAPGDLKSGPHDALPLAIGLLHSIFAVKAASALSLSNLTFPAAIAMWVYTLIYFLFAVLTVVYYRRIVREAL